MLRLRCNPPAGSIGWVQTRKVAYNRELATLPENSTARQTEECEQLSFSWGATSDRHPNGPDAQTGSMASSGQFRPLAPSAHRDHEHVEAVLAVSGRIQATGVRLDVEIIQYSLRRNPAFTARPDPSRANSVYELVANACSLADPHTDFGSSTCSCFESMWRNL